jgi:hypothetical protein
MTPLTIAMIALGAIELARLLGCMIDILEGRHV